MSSLQDQIDRIHPDFAAKHLNRASELRKKLEQVQKTVPIMVKEAQKIMNRTHQLPPLYPLEEQAVPETNFTDEGYQLPINEEPAQTYLSTERLLYQDLGNWEAAPSKAAQTDGAAETTWSYLEKNVESAENQGLVYDSSIKYDDSHYAPAAEMTPKAWAEQTNHLYPTFKVREDEESFDANGFEPSHGTLEYVQLVDVTTEDGSVIGYQSPKIESESKPSEESSTGSFYETSRSSSSKYQDISTLADNVDNASYVLPGSFQTTATENTTTITTALIEIETIIGEAVQPSTTPANQIVPLSPGKTPDLRQQLQNLTTESYNLTENRVFH